ELADTDRLVGELVAALPAHVAVLVTSDHGQIHLERGSWIELPEIAARCGEMGGAGSFRYLVARKGGAPAAVRGTRHGVGGGTASVGGAWGWWGTERRAPFRAASVRSSWRHASRSRSSIAR